jgi:hypothetical protein
MENIKNSEKQSFRDWLVEAVNEGKMASYRADPIVVATDAGLINKNVMPGIDVLTSPGEAFLRQIGVTFFSGLNGNFVVPSMGQDTGVFVAEASDAGGISANMASASLTLAARRITHSQAISKETLAQTSPTVYSAIVQNLVNGFWNCLVNDVYDQIDADATTQITSLGRNPTFSDVVNQEASLNGLYLTSPAYVTTPAEKAYLTRTAYMTNQVGIWYDNKINGYDAYCTPAANVNKIYFGDWSRVCVGLWGSTPYEIIVDPYTDSKKGLISLTIVGMADTGCYNKRGFAILADASTT